MSAVASRSRSTHAPEDQTDQKRKVLKRSQASTVRSISDAVVIKDGDPFFLCPPDGQIPLDGEHGYGLFQHDTQFLAGYEVEILGTAPEPLAATAAAGREAILELTNPKIDLDDGRSIGKDRLSLRWTRTLDGQAASLTDVIEVANRDPDDVELNVRIRIAAGFRDIFEIRGLLEEPPGTRHEPVFEDGRLVLAFDGRDHVRRVLTAEFEPTPSARDGSEVSIDLPVSGRGSGRIRVVFAMDEAVPDDAPPVEGGPSRPEHDRASAEGTREPDRDRWIGGGDWTVSLKTDSPTFDAVMERSLADVDLLRTRLDGHTYIGAGLPWFSALFGRDSLIVAMQMLAYDASIAAGTLRLLAGRQGTTVDDWRDEEPGRILHELRVGELARLGRIPQTPYFGTVDATPLFLILLVEHARWTGSLDLFHELEENVARAFDWIDEREDADSRGYLSYASTSDGGLANQGWKDSGDGIVDGEGRIARPPIALAEVQGYVYAARTGMAALFERAGDADRARVLREQANRLAQQFERDFWSDDLEAYVLALQGDGSACSVVSSNAGQVLFSGIASDDHAGRIGRRLFASDMYSGWGIRTLSSDAVAYNPVGYHLGTVWPHDNSLIAAGLRRYGNDAGASRIMGSLVAAAGDFEHARLPECFAGMSRPDFGIPVRYPVACHPQAWAAGSVPYLLIVNLGLRPTAFEQRLEVIRPQLPEFLDEVRMRGLAIGSASVDLVFRRVGGSTDVAIERIDGELDVSVEPATPKEGSR